MQYAPRMRIRNYRPDTGFAQCCFILELVLELVDYIGIPNYVAILVGDVEIDS